MARFQSIAAQETNSFVVNAGFQALTELSGNERVQALNRRQIEQLTPWTEVRHDFITCELALEFLRAKNPTVLYLGLGETDDWAHDGRYPRVVWAASYFDQCLREFVTYIDTHPKYKGKTLLVITTDHGRGRTVDDWTKHSRKIEGSEETRIFHAGAGDWPIRRAPRYHNTDAERYCTHDSEADGLPIFNATRDGRALISSLTSSGTTGCRTRHFRHHTPEIDPVRLCVEAKKWQLFQCIRDS